MCARLDESPREDNWDAETPWDPHSLHNDHYGGREGEGRGGGSSPHAIVNGTSNTMKLGIQPAI